MIPRTYAEAKKQQVATKARRTRRNAKARLLGGVSRLLTKSVIKARLWALVSEYARLRDREWFITCRICRRRPIQCAYHLIPSNDGAATRYDLDNIVGACNPCNNGERLHRFKYRLKHIDIFGKEWIEHLEAKASKAHQYSRADLLEMIGTFKKRIETRSWMARAQLDTPEPKA
jgi:5-methylcytosine-specific restriction endonuclease McrA